MVLNLVMYESERKPPRRENAQVPPKKLVMVVEEVATPMYITLCK